MENSRSDQLIHADNASLEAWRQDDLELALTTLSQATQGPGAEYYRLANLAVIKARLEQWDEAEQDASASIQAQRTVLGHIAMSIVLGGQGKLASAKQAFNQAFLCDEPKNNCLLLLIKSIIIFVAGEHNEATRRVTDLVEVCEATDRPLCLAVQAQMRFLVGKTALDGKDYQQALESFTSAGNLAPFLRVPELEIISLIFGWNFDSLPLIIRERTCDALEAAGQIIGAVQSFQRLLNEFEAQTKSGEHLQWVLEFRQRSSERLERLGDAAADSQQYGEAISHYTTALSLEAPSLQSLLIKRSKAYVASDSWKEALDDANQVITLDPSSPWGYEMKHAALHEAGDYENAVVAFEMMLSKMTESPDPDVRQRCDHYVSPSSTQAAIRRTIQRTIHRLPRVLINTITGRLHDEADQASAFEALPLFNELVSSMTRRIDIVRIKREVRQFFRYATFSHTWEAIEPSFHQVVHVGVYDLDKDPTHDKLQTFCKVVRDAGFIWGWSYSCCVNISDHIALQEALIAMFKWHQGAALVIVFLRGVRSPSRRGDLVGSIWNTRAWTLQEYIAAKVIRFYTEDWTPYLDLPLTNHKNSPEIISEMEAATGVSEQQLRALRPGLTNIRKKLRLASTRQTARVENAAYSLFGIFGVTGVPHNYGEGEVSLGRLLAHILSGSGDTSILAWTGKSGNFNSCLPAHITVFNGPATSHLPQPIPDDEMERIVTASSSPSFDLDVALRLYDRVNTLPPPSFAGQRMRLPCIAFELPPLTPYQTPSGHFYRADTTTFGTIEIKTRQNLSQLGSLYLIHPWLDTILGRMEIQSGTLEDEVAPRSPNTDDEDIDDDSSFLEPEGLSGSAPVRAVPVDRETGARRLVARLRQPFGALLLTGSTVTAYRRVAADSSITVQLQENVSLADVLDHVQTLNAL